ncbi:hypothetical protein [Pseudomonas sp. NA-150]|uniref:hypothetical protein n=1 Tax=Pseudomonas sp. NA-150 TaxID=3367525 RepID=UPI0037C79304
MIGSPDRLEATRRCAGLFRLGRDVEAALDMVELFTELMPLFSKGPTVRQQQWLELLKSMLKCQEARDSLGLADYLEYELVELLQVTV